MLKHARRVVNSARWVGELGVSAGLTDFGEYLTVPAY
jgi:hypothetical protein